MSDDTKPRQDRTEVEGRPLSFWIAIATAIAVVVIGFGAWWVWGWVRACRWTMPAT